MLEIYKIETLGALDGPGLRTVVFLQGCPMRCGYCHNADSWCTGEGTWMTSEAIFRRILRAKPYFKDNGGVTFSGGEPLLQAEKLLPLVQRLHEAGIHVVLDTSGCLVSEVGYQLLSTVDLVILDIKANDDASYRTLARHGIEAPLKILAYLNQIQKPYWIRQVILNGVNDDLENLVKLEEMTRGTAREKLEVLPYHAMGMHKWKEDQLQFHGNFEVPDADSMRSLCNWLENTLK